jgi:hypothetical protein
MELEAALLASYGIGWFDPLRDGGLYHSSPFVDVADGRHGFVRLPHRMKDRHGLVDMFRPDLVDLCGRRRIAAFGIAAVCRPRKNTGDALNKWAI